MASSPPRAQTHDLHHAIRAAWFRLRPILLRDPTELHRRLARRRLALLQRPPRAWCLALRASDHRINTLPSPIHRSSMINHHSPPSSVQHSSFIIQHSSLRALTWPLLLPAPGLPARDVARQLGVSPAGLLTARLAGRFHTRHIPPTAGRGKPVPILFTRRPLDPQARAFAEPDPLWGWTAQYLVDRFDESNFTPQTLTRIPVFRPISDIYRRLRAQSPEQAEQTPPRPSRKLPPPAPDYVWYKWSHTGQYLGDDPRFWRKSPQDPGDPTAAQRAAAAARSATTNPHARKTRAQNLRRQFRAMEDALDPPDPDDAHDRDALPQRGTGGSPMHSRPQAAPPDSSTGTPAHPSPPNADPRTPNAPRASRSTAVFNGHAWLCPACNKTCRTLYLPVPPPPLDTFLTPPPGHPASKKLARLIAAADFVDENHPDHLPPPLNCFACVRCHRVQYISRSARWIWNFFIARLTGGLLYGHEVEKPLSWRTLGTPAAERKRPYMPRPGRAPSQRRAQVLRLLTVGAPTAAIARELGISPLVVRNYLKEIYRQHDVHGRAELAQKLGCLQVQKVPRPRFGQSEILPHLLAGKSLPQIAKETGVKLASVHSAARRAYRQHGVTTREQFAKVTHSPRPEPAEVRPSPRRDEVKRRLLAGETYKQIAAAMGITKNGVGVVANKIYRMHGVRSRKELQLTRMRQSCAMAST